MQNVVDDIRQNSEDDTEFDPDEIYPESYLERYVDIDSIPEERQKVILENQRYSSDTRDRKWLAVRTVYAVSAWLILVILVLFANHSFIHLSDAVLVTLLGTTTLNVLGLTAIILRGHFNAK